MKVFQDLGTCKITKLSKELTDLCKVKNISCNICKSTFKGREIRIAIGETTNIKYLSSNHLMLVITKYGQLRQVSSIIDTDNVLLCPRCGEPYTNGLQVV